MNHKAFDKFVQRKRDELEAVESFDDKQQLSEWYKYLDILYEMVIIYVKPYIDAGTMSVEYKTVQINEEFSGLYEMQSMILRVGNSTVVFEPIGTMLIGSKGRVDVHGPLGTARLSLINKKLENARQMIQVRILLAGQSTPPPETVSEPEEIEWVWKIASPPPAMKFITLSEETFYDMILGIADA